MIAVTLLAVAMAADAGPRFAYTERHMGVEVRVLLYADDEAHARTAARAALDCVQAWDEALSDWHDTSDAMRLPHAAGGSATVSGRLAMALDTAERAREATDGAFDTSLGALTHLWRQARRTGREPDAAALGRARQASGRGSCVWDAAARRFTALQEGVRVDFGAIAQGLAADDALAALRAHGCPQALVDVSGDIAVGAPPPGEPGWRVRIEPEFAGQPDETLVLRECGVSTSGDRGQPGVVQGHAASHIVDPALGTPLRTPRQATVVAPDATTADALATAFCVLPSPACRHLAVELHVASRLDRDISEGGVQALAGWDALRRASSCQAAEPSAPVAARPSPVSEASGPPCSP